jgi:plasmid stabilization system protein ParE
MPPDDGPTRRYQVVRAERAEKDQDDAFLRRNGLLGPRVAAEWLKGLDNAIADLANFPGPRSHTIDDLASNRFGVEVRRMLYYGPTGRRSGTPYRVLFTIIEPAPGENEGVVRVLRILHGASDPFGPEPDNQEST